MAKKSKGTAVKAKEKKSVGAIIRDTIVNIIMVLSIILFAIALYSGYINQDNPDEAFLLGYKPVYVMTGSMEPTLKVNGVVIIKQIDYDDVQVDDIIMYEIDDKMITHRVVEITDEGIRTKGDNNNVKDAYLLQPENIKGKAVAIWNWTATIVNKFSTTSGRTQLIILAALVVFLILFIIGISIILKAKKQEKLKAAEVEADEPEESIEEDEPVREETDEVLDEEELIQEESDEEKEPVESIPEESEPAPAPATVISIMPLPEPVPQYEAEEVTAAEGVHNDDSTPRKAVSDEESDNTIYIPLTFFEGGM